jgi:hypothetical protein
METPGTYKFQFNFSQRFRDPKQLIQKYNDTKKCINGGAWYFLNFSKIFSNKKAKNLLIYNKIKIFKIFIR